jgi:hypothetical protein
MWLIDDELVTRWGMWIFITFISFIWHPWLMTKWRGHQIVITMTKKWYKSFDMNIDNCIPPPTYVPNYLPTHPPTYLPSIYACIIHPPTHLPTYLSTYLFTNLPTYLPTHSPTPPTYLPTHPITTLTLASLPRQGLAKV